MLCVSLGKTSQDKIKNISEESDLVELRLDLNDFDIPEIEEIFGSSDNLIATCRSGKSDSERKISMMTAIKSGAKYVDLDLFSDKRIVDELMKEARNKNCKIILSYHNYKKTPPKEELELICKDLFGAGADIAKIACMVHSRSDLLKLLSLYKEKKDLIAVGMGALGKITRVAGYFLGAPIVYSSYGNSKTASGQMDYKELKKVIETISNG